MTTDSAHNASAQRGGESTREGELIARVEETAEEIKEEVSEIRALFSGPIPPPELLGQYDGVLPGLADRIVSMAETEGQHRRSQERTALQSEINANRKLVEAHIKEKTRGQFMAFAIAIFALAVGSYVAVQGAPFAGAVIGAGGLASIVTAFLRSDKKDESSAHSD